MNNTGALIRALAVLIVGALVTTLAMEGEKKPFRRPLVMMMGLGLTVLAIGGRIAMVVCK